MTDKTPGIPNSKPQIDKAKALLKDATDKLEAEIATNKETKEELSKLQTELRASKQKTKNAYELAVKFEKNLHQSELKLHRALGYIDRIVEGESKVLHNNQPYVEPMTTNRGPQINE